MAHLLDQNRAAISRHGVSIDIYGFFGLLRSVRHSLERRVRDLLLIPDRPAKKPELANVLAGQTAADVKPNIYVVDTSLLHLRSKKLLEHVRSNALLQLHKVMLERQFGLKM